MSSNKLIQPIDVDPYSRREYPDRDDNFENLLDNWDRYKNNLIIFLGAGASIGARNRFGRPLPAAFQLRNQIWRSFMLAPSERETYDMANIGVMSLEHASALAEARSDRNSLLEFLVETFFVERPLWQHAVLPFFAPKALMTTNYDSLIELGWRLHTGRSGIPQLLPLFRNGEKIHPGLVPLYKPHGSVEVARNDVGHGGLAISQFDYFEILTSRSEMLTEFMSEFQESCVLFIGYGFQDMDIAAQLFKLRKIRTGPLWYAVFPRNDRDVRNMYQEHYRIRQINRTFFDFVVDLDERINIIPAEWKADQLTSLVSSGRVAGPPGLPE